MSAKQHVVTLTPEQRAELGVLLRRERTPVLAHRRARILLAADAGVGGPRLTDREVGAVVGQDPRTVARVRALFGERGLAAALGRRSRRDAGPRLLGGAEEARLVVLACSAPPAGHARWSLRLLAGRLVELEVVPAVSHEAVRRTLKKTSSSRG